MSTVAVSRRWPSARAPRAALGHPVTLRHVAGGQAVERRFHRLAPELADQPADGTGEAQVVGLAGGTAAPAHPARDLQACDQSRDETRQDSGRGATLGLDADDGELRAADHLAADVPGLGAARAREPQPGLGKAALSLIHISEPTRLGMISYA